ncbi:MAG: serine protease, partial [Gammaproteobacteria bacterium HGW-Gammaproteobacteria-7]
MAGDKPRLPAKADSGSSRRVALVLGAGGARGLAHIGAIQALLRREYQIAAIGGSSMGALIGGVHAAGRLDAYRDWACALERSDVFRLLDFTFGNPGFIKGERVINAIRELVGDHRIEDLPIPYMAVATDLKRQREVWLTRGPLFDAIRASIAIP